MKKTKTAILAIILTLALCGCGILGNPIGNGNDDKPDTSSQAPENKPDAPKPDAPEPDAPAPAPEPDAPAPAPDAPEPDSPSSGGDSPDIPDTDNSQNGGDDNAGGSIFDNLPGQDEYGREDDLIPVSKEMKAKVAKMNEDEPQINWDHMYSIRGYEGLVVCSETFEYEDQNYCLIAIENTLKREVIVEAGLTVTHSNGDMVNMYSLYDYRVGAENGTYSLLYQYDVSDKDFHIQLSLNSVSYAVEEEYDVDYEIDDDFDMTSSDYVIYHFKLTNTCNREFHIGGENVYVLNKKGDVLGFREREYDHVKELKPGMSFEDSMEFYGLAGKKKEVDEALFCSYIVYVDGQEVPGTDVVDHGQK